MPNTNNTPVSREEIEAWAKSWVKYISVATMHSTDDLRNTKDAIKQYDNTTADFTNSLESLITQSLKAFADEVERVIGGDEPQPDIPVNDYYWRFRNELRDNQRSALKDLKEKWGIE